MIVVILGGMLAGNLALWAWGWRRLRRQPRVRWALLLLFHLPVSAQIVWMFVSRDTAIRQHEWLPTFLIALTYFWNLVVLPLALLGAGLGALVGRVLRRDEPAPDPSRRRFLGAAAALLPPVAAGGGIALALPRLNDFRVRRIRVPVAGLPEALDGLTIAHVSDVHYGKFTEPRVIGEVVAAVNGLGADLVLMTGDLIDLSLRDLDPALEMAGALRGGSGLFLCEGNHDLIDDGAAFRRRVEAAGVPLVRDRAETVRVRGEAVQILGARWERGAGARREATRAVAARRDPDAFPILLAHHPHSFDHADGIPLTLSGHTHGGLLMLSETLGPGPILYKYWSGLYRRGGRSLVVSNGIGSWFPVRTHAPAEIIHLTLAPKKEEA